MAIHPDDLEVALSNFARHRDDPSFPYDQLVRYRHKDGSWVWVRCRGLVIRDAQGKPYRMLGAHNEVTELMQAQLSLRDANAELRRSNSALEDFASAASHDLRAPLRTIHGYVEIVLEDHGEAMPPEAAELLGRVLESAKQVDRQLRGLLACARVGQAGAPRGSIGLHIVESHGGALQVATSSADGSTFSFSLPRGRPRNVQGPLRR